MVWSRQEVSPRIGALHVAADPAVTPPDVATAALAVVDESATILRANDAWAGFTRARGGPLGVGDDYLDAFRRAPSAAGVDALIPAGIAQVLRGDSGGGWLYEGVDGAGHGGDIAMRCPPGRPQRIDFTRPPATGTTVRLECIQTVTASDGMVNVGSPCSSDCSLANGRREIMERWPGLLACEPVSQTCQPQCAGTEQCAGGYVCADLDGDGPQFRVNPTCAMN